MTRVTWSNKKLRAPIPRKLLKEHVEGKILKTIDRRAKYLLFRMDDGAVMVIHLGMTGKVGLFQQRKKIAKHDHLRIAFNNSMEMRLNDARRFGSVVVWSQKGAEEQERKFSAKEGIEPFSNQFSAEVLYHLASKRTIPVKSFLMQSRIIAGIGNIYANEILFAARVHPQTSVNVLRKRDWQYVIEAAQTILTRAIAAGGTTISDFLNSSGQPGYFQVELNVYNKLGSPCPECTTLIKKEILAGRATYFCSTCQRVLT